jgi:hypothetical protein
MDTSCHDTVAKGDNHPFRTTVAVRSGGMMTVPLKAKGAEGTEGPVGTSYNNVACNYCRDQMGEYQYPHQLDVEPSMTLLATKLVNQTNPSRPEVSLPSFIGELKDVPGLLKSLGKSSLSKVAGTNLNYQFGIAPLVGDLFKLIDVQGAAAKRSKELTALRSSGLRRKRILHRGSVVGVDQGFTLNHVDYYVSSVRTLTLSKTYTGFCRWVPDGTTDLPATDDDMRSLAMKTVLGWSLRDLHADAWELFPWSWLADWYGNFGEFLGATRNSVGATPLDICIMTESLFDDYFAVKQNVGHGKYCTDLHIVAKQKTRTPASIGLAAQLPFLSARKLSILGSLAVLRLKL